MAAQATGRGLAIFSTNLGRQGPRAAVPLLPPVIARTLGVRDCKYYARYLREKFPVECGDIFLDYNMDDYFDSYDMHVQSPGFLYGALHWLRAENHHKLLAFVVQWSEHNPHRLPELCVLQMFPEAPLDAVNLVFNEEELKVHSKVFLWHALNCMRDAMERTTQAQLNPMKNTLVQTDQVNLGTPTVEPSPSSIAAPTENELSPQPIHQEQKLNIPKRGQSPKEPTPATPPVSLSQDLTSFVSKRTVSAEMHGPVFGQNGSRIPDGPRGGGNFSLPQSPIGMSPMVSQAQPYIRQLRSGPYNNSSNTQRHRESRAYAENIQFGNTYRRNDTGYFTGRAVEGQHGAAHAGRYPDHSIVGQQLRQYSQFVAFDGQRMMPSIEQFPHFSHSSAFAIHPGMPSPSAIMISPQMVTRDMVRGRPITEVTNIPGAVTQYVGHSHQEYRGDRRDPMSTFQGRGGYGRGGSSARGRKNSFSFVNKQGDNRRFSIGSASGRGGYKGRGAYQGATYTHHHNEQFLDSVNEKARQAEVHLQHRSPPKEPFPKFETYEQLYEPFAGDKLFPGRNPDDVCLVDFIGMNREDVRVLWVTGYPPETSEQELRVIFEQKVAIEDIVMKCQPKGQGYSFITFHSSGDARTALQFNGACIGDKHVSIQVPDRYRDDQPRRYSNGSRHQSQSYYTCARAVAPRVSNANEQHQAMLVRNGRTHGMPGVVPGLQVMHHAQGRSQPSVRHRSGSYMGYSVQDARSDLPVTGASENIATRADAGEHKQKGRTKQNIKLSPSKLSPSKLSALDTTTDQNLKDMDIDRSSTSVRKAIRDMQGDEINNSGIKQPNQGKSKVLPQISAHNDVSRADTGQSAGKFSVTAETAEIRESEDEMPFQIVQESSELNDEDITILASTPRIGSPVQRSVITLAAQTELPETALEALVGKISVATEVVVPDDAEASAPQGDVHALLEEIYKTTEAIQLPNDPHMYVQTASGPETEDKLVIPASENLGPGSSTPPSTPDRVLDHEDGKKLDESFHSARSTQSPIESDAAAGTDAKKAVKADDGIVTPKDASSVIGGAELETTSTIVERESETARADDRANANRIVPPVATTFSTAQSEEPKKGTRLLTQEGGSIHPFARQKATRKQPAKKKKGAAKTRGKGKEKEVKQTQDVKPEASASNAPEPKPLRVPDDQISEPLEKDLHFTIEAAKIGTLDIPKGTKATDVQQPSLASVTSEVEQPLTGDSGASATLAETQNKQIPSEITLNQSNVATLGVPIHTSKEDLPAQQIEKKKGRLNWNPVAIPNVSKLLSSRKYSIIKADSKVDTKSELMEGMSVSQLDAKVERKPERLERDLAPMLDKKDHKVSERPESSPAVDASPILPSTAQTIFLSQQTQTQKYTRADWAALPAQLREQDTAEIAQRKEEIKNNPKPDYRPVYAQTSIITSRGNGIGKRKVIKKETTLLNAEQEEALRVEAIRHPSPDSDASSSTIGSHESEKFVTAPPTATIAPEMTLPLTSRSMIPIPGAQITTFPSVAVVSQIPERSSSPPLEPISDEHSTANFSIVEAPKMTTHPASPPFESATKKKSKKKKTKKSIDGKEEEMIAPTGSVSFPDKANYYQPTQQEQANISEAPNSSYSMTADGGAILDAKARRQRRKYDKMRLKKAAARASRPASGSDGESEVQSKHGHTVPVLSANEFAEQQIQVDAVRKGCSSTTGSYYDKNNAIIDGTQAQASAHHQASNMGSDGEVLFAPTGLGDPTGIPFRYGSSSSQQDEKTPSPPSMKHYMISNNDYLGRMDAAEAIPGVLNHMLPVEPSLTEVEMIVQGNARKNRMRGMAESKSQENDAAWNWATPKAKGDSSDTIDVSPVTPEKGETQRKVRTYIVTDLSGIPERHANVD